MTESEDSALNKPLFEVIYNYGEITFNFIAEYLSGYVSSVKHENIPQLIPVVTFYDQFLETFYFNDIQLLLLKTVLCILLVTLLLVVLSWRVYGKKISDRFLKPSSTLAIERLKESVSKLKLPKDYSPRN